MSEIDHHFQHGDDVAEVLDRYFDEIDEDQNKKVTRAEIISALAANKSVRGNLKAEMQEWLAKLETVVADMNEADGIEKEKFKEIASKVPGIKGDRIQWARTLNLDGLLARQIKVGTPFDELLGLKRMTSDEISEALDRFSKAVSKVFFKALEDLKLEDDDSASLSAANSKFSDDMSKFG